MIASGMICMIYKDLYHSYHAACNHAYPVFNFIFRDFCILRIFCVYELNLGLKNSFV